MAHLKLLQAYLEEDVWALVRAYAFKNKLTISMATKILIYKGMGKTHKDEMRVRVELDEIKVLAEHNPDSISKEALSSSKELAEPSNNNMKSIVEEEIEKEEKEPPILDLNKFKSPFTHRFPIGRGP